MPPNDNKSLLNYLNDAGQALCVGEQNRDASLSYAICLKMQFVSYSVGYTFVSIHAYTQTMTYVAKTSYWCSSAICFCMSAVYCGPAGLIVINCGWPMNCIPGFCIPIAIPPCETNKYQRQQLRHPVSMSPCHTLTHSITVFPRCTALGGGARCGRKDIHIYTQKYIQTNINGRENNVLHSHTEGNRFNSE